MKRDELVAEVRRVREAHAEKFGFDLERIAEDIRRGEEELRNKGWTVISGKPKERSSVR